MNFSVTDGRGLAPSATFGAGRETSSCTSGFAAQKTQRAIVRTKDDDQEDTAEDTSLEYLGYYGIITAGHCGIEQEMHEVGLPHVFGWKAPAADAQFHIIPHDPYDSDSSHKLLNKYWCKGPGPPNYERWCRITSKIDKGNNSPRYQMMGAYVCHTRRNSKRSCGKITSIQFRPEFKEDKDKCLRSPVGEIVECLNVFVKVEGLELKVCKGDSGGPWYSDEGIAFGIHSSAFFGKDSMGNSHVCTGENPRAFFSAISEVEEFLGVEVLTSSPVGPKPPRNVSGSVCDQGVSLVWDPPHKGGGAFYKVERSSATEPYSVIATTTSTSYLDPIAGLSPNTEYSYRIRAFNNLHKQSGLSLTSARVVSRPGIPSRITVNVSAYNIWLSWTAPPGGAARYKIWRRAEPTGKPPIKQYIGETPDTSFVDPVSGLLPAMPYSYIISAVNSTGKAGDWVRITGITTAPAAPTGVTARATAAGIRLAWDDTQGAARYQVRSIPTQGPPSQPFTVLDEPKHTSYLHLATQLTPGSKYKYRIVAIDTNGQTSLPSAAITVTAHHTTTPPQQPPHQQPPPATTTTTTTTTTTVPTVVLPPGRPTNLSASTTGGGIRLSWDAADHAVSYQIRRRQSSGSSPSRTIATTDTTTYTDRGLMSGVRYTYHVIAINSAGNRSPASRYVTVAAPGAPPPTAHKPANFTATVTAAGIGLSWDAADHAVSYRIQRRPANRNSSRTITTTSKTTYTDTGVSPSTAYFYQIIPLNRVSAAGRRSDIIKATALP